MNLKDIQTQLLSLNVGDRIEEKNGLSYLSWSWAWTELLKIYPEATYEIKRFGEKQLPYVYDENTGYMVFTNITIEGITREMWLPVMDSANKSMLNHVYTYKVKKWNDFDRKYEYVEKDVQPATMFDINKTIMRCLVKNIAMFGLGMYIYSGEDLPEQLDDTKDSDTTNKAIKEKNTETKSEDKKASPKQIEMLLKYYKDDNLTKLLKANNIQKIEDISLTKASELISNIFKKEEENKNGSN